MNRQEIEEKASEAAATPGLTVHTANCIALFTMYILQDLLVQQLVNPLTNFNNIIALSSTIADLNTSVKPLPI